MIPAPSGAGASYPADGETFAAISVSEFNRRVRDRLQSDPLLREIWVEGEIANFNNHSSGHVYFSLKDADSTLSCTFFRNAAQRHRHVRLANGLKILAQGAVSVYPPRGQYQFNVLRVVAVGEGELRLKIEELRRRLELEGLFRSDRKRALPEMPFTLGVATASTGAAIRDIIRVAQSRFPGINILLAPCIVQGDGAEGSIIEAIQVLNRPEYGVDVIIAGRGGGSFEDLLAFNSESVVRAFAASRVPIVSAVGHEIDHPLTDLAADAYAPTPSGAAEQVVPEIENIFEALDELPARMRIALRNRRNQELQKLERALRARVYREPLSILAERNQSLDLAKRDLCVAMSRRLESLGARLSPYAMIPAYAGRHLQSASKRCAIAGERLQNFSPLATLKRGYAVLRSDRGEVIRSVSQTAPGEGLEALLADGRLRVRVEEPSA